jgi:NAD-dependent dihydropyrimidine dehydrogenase PreA subunit
MADECGGLPGKVAPVVDRNRCEGKAACVRVCPYNVFVMGTLTQEQFESILGKMKAWAHGETSHGRERRRLPRVSAMHQSVSEQALTLAPIRL